MSSEGFERITEEECRQLLAGRGLGRIGFSHGGLILVMPVYFVTIKHDILFRTSPGAKLDAAVLNNRVAFEVDNEAAGWSVLVTGHAAEIREGEQLERAREALADRWPPGMRERFVRVGIEHISGRRLARAADPG
jgi:nitroimidazol reductase NimA-like FMN-containing flavoprotein (pyridoxamine 5'-phosphate oxidase superfamily)